MHPSFLHRLTALATWRRFTRRAWFIHALVIAQLILLPAHRAHAVWVEVDTDGDGFYDSSFDDGTAPPFEVQPPFVETQVTPTDNTPVVDPAPAEPSAVDPPTTVDPPAAPVPDAANVQDSDGDNLTDAQETELGTSPYTPDSDNDGLTDADETNLTGTDPNTADSNADGNSDYNEFYGNYSVNILDLGPGVKSPGRESVGFTESCDGD